MENAIGKTDVGLKRERNEDFIFCNDANHGPLRNLYVLADGMGGHNAGNVASELATEEFCGYVRSKDAANFTYIEDLLADALRYANTKVHTRSSNDSACFGMGTTLTAVCYDDNNLYYAHVGDSRMYIVTKDGVLRQISRDHSLVNEMLAEGMITAEEAVDHPRRNVLVRAVGTDYAVQVDKGYHPLDNVARILLCSDGLSDLVSDYEIADIINNTPDLDKCAQLLINKANEAGGNDNISVILL